MERHTLQRKLILKAVENLGHANVDEIYEYCLKALPKLSFSTVYRNVIVLENDCLIRRIPNRSTKDVFESTVKLIHDHFICTKCGKLIDYEPNISSKVKNDVFGNLIQETTKISYGICTECQKKKAL